MLIKLIHRNNICRFILEYYVLCNNTKFSPSANSNIMENKKNHAYE